MSLTQARHPLRHASPRGLPTRASPELPLPARLLLRRDLCTAVETTGWVMAFSIC